MAEPGERQQPISPGHAKRLRSLLRERGLKQLHDATGFDRQTLTKAGCELDLNRSARLSIERYLDTLEHEDRSAAE
jgi:hypothetical protein